MDANLKINKNLYTQVNTSVEKTTISDENKITNKIKEIFKINSEDLNSMITNQKEGYIKSLILSSFNLASKRLKQKEPITEVEVSRISQLFLEEKLIFGEANFNELIVNENKFINPHPYEIFSNLEGFFGRFAPQINSCQSILDSIPCVIQKTKSITETPQLSVQFETTEDSDYRLGKRELQSHPGTEPEGSKKLAIEVDFDNHQSSKQDLLRDYPIVSLHKFFSSSETANSTYVLIGENKKCFWVFKPQEKNENGEIIIRREQTSSLVNFHHNFPIPLTIILQVKDWTGSAQLFIDSTRSMESFSFDDNYSFGDKLITDLQKIIIFDLIFSNTDRNLGNILLSCTKSDNSEKLVVDAAYGVDHDSCMPGLEDSIGTMLDFGDLMGFSLGDEKELGDIIFDIQQAKLLLSNDCISEYEIRMRENQIPEEAIFWMKTAAHVLTDLVLTDKTIEDVTELVGSLLKDIAELKKKRTNAPLTFDDMINLWKEIK